MAPAKPSERIYANATLSRDFAASATSSAASNAVSGEPLRAEGRLGYALACRARETGLSEPTLLELMLEHWNERCDPLWEVEELATIVASACRYARNPPGASSPLVVFGDVTGLLPVAEASSSTCETITADVLIEMEFDPLQFIVPDLLPEGLTLLAGKPKLGKSFLALDLGLAVASGGLAFGSLEVEAGDVLYYALEDSERRLKDRLKQMQQMGMSQQSQRSQLLDKGDELGLLRLLGQGDH